MKSKDADFRISPLNVRVVFKSEEVESLVLRVRSTSRRTRKKIEGLRRKAGSPRLEAEEFSLIEEGINREISRWRSNMLRLGVVPVDMYQAKIRLVGGKSLTLNCLSGFYF